MISAKVELTQALKQQRQFVALRPAADTIFCWTMRLVEPVRNRSNWLRRAWPVVPRSMSSPCCDRSITRKSQDTKFGSRPIRRSVPRKCLRRCGFTT